MIGIDTTFLVHLELRESPQHRGAHELLAREVINRGTPAALTPQVLSEFAHVITDPRRFERPVSLAEAISRAQFWWNAREIHRIYPARTRQRCSWSGCGDSVSAANVCSTRNSRRRCGWRASVAS